MNCRNCGNQINDGAVFCTRCGARQVNEQVNGAYMTGNQPFTPYYGVNYGASQPNKKKSKGIVAAIAVVVIVGGVCAKNYFYSEINPQKQGEGGNTTTTGKSTGDGTGEQIFNMAETFQELGKDETKFCRYSLEDYTDEEKPNRHAILEQDAIDINNSDMMDGIHLLTYENEDVCNSYFCDDMMEILSEEMPQRLDMAVTNESGNWYLVKVAGGMFGDHSYCFYIDGNYMLYATTNTDGDAEPYEYLNQNGYSDILNLDMSDGEFYDIIDNFLDAYNNR